MSLGCAVLGVGRIGQVHCDALARVEAATLRAVFDPVDAAAQSMADKHGCAIRDLDAIEADDDIAAVLICTPTDTHADLIERFAKAGKAVFCEKPIDLDLSRVRQCLSVVAETGTPLMLGFQRRFDPHFKALKAQLEAGRIGKVEQVALTSRDPAPPPVSYIERSGGIFRDMMIHDLDVARWLLEEVVATVYATGACLVDPAIGAAGDMDTASVILTTVSGKQASIQISRRAAYGYDQRIEVHGETGALRAENAREANIAVWDADGAHEPPLLDFFMERYAPAYANEIAAFAEAVANGSPMPTTGEDGLRALELAEAAHHSAGLGRAVKIEEVRP